MSDRLTGEREVPRAGRRKFLRGREKPGTDHVTVLSHPGRTGNPPNPTLVMLIDSLPSYVHHVDFTWKRALLGKYDVLHVHWPEYMLRAPRRIIRLAKRAVFLAVLLRVKSTSRAVLWTVHNRNPHESGDLFERALLRLWNWIATHRVYQYRAGMDESSERAASFIPHGDYAPIYAAYAAVPLPVEGPPVVLLFGLLRPYKNVEHLLGIFNEGGLGGVRLVVAGRPITDSYGSSLVQRSSNSSNIEVRLGHLSDGDLVREIQAARLVILPYERIYNSGAALLALTLGRPILVRASETMNELRMQVGSHWVHTYTADLTSTDIVEALSVVPEGMPDLRAFDWRTIGEKYGRLYVDLGRRHPGRARQEVAN